MNVEKGGMFEQLVSDVTKDAKKTEEESLAYLQKIGMDDGYKERKEELEEDKAVCCAFFHIETVSMILLSYLLVHPSIDMILLSSAIINT